MLRQRFSYIMCLVLCAGCSRLPAQQEHSCTVTFTASAAGKALLPGYSPYDYATDLHFYIFSASGELVTMRSADPGGSTTCSIELPPDRYIWRVSAGDAPDNPASLEEYEYYLPSFGVEGGPEGFPMSAGGSLMAGSGHGRVDAILNRNYCRIVVRSLSVTDSGPNVFRMMRSVHLDRIYLMGVPDRVHMDGRRADGEPGCRLLNCWRGNAAEFCSGGMARCTIAEFQGGTFLSPGRPLPLQTTLYCFPSALTGIVVECSGTDLLGKPKTLFWTFGESFQAGYSYECDITLAGAGNASPISGGGCPGSIDIEIADWKEVEGAGYRSNATGNAPIYTAGNLSHPGDCADVDFIRIFGDTAVESLDSCVVRSIGAGKHWKLFAVGPGQTTVSLYDGLNFRIIQYTIQSTTHQLKIDGLATAR